MKKSSGQAIGKGATYIYIETIVAMISGYALWLFLSKITTSEIIGAASTVVSLASIFTTVVTIGIPNGVPRFLGKSFSEQQLHDAKMFIKASLLLVSIAILACSTIILIVKDWIYGTFDFSLIILSILLIGSSAITILFRAIVIASLNTKSLPMVMIISSAIKIVLAVILILMGTGALGLIIAYVFNQIIASVLLVFTVFTIFKASKSEPGSRFNHTSKSILVAGIPSWNTSKSILVAGIPSWIPALITTIGAQLGTIIVFGSEGASQAGTYFIAFSVFSAISVIMSALFSIAFPALSAMHDGRKRFSWRLIKLSLVISLPFSSPLIFYSNEIMGLLGRDYVEGSSSLEILLLSMLPTAVMTGINTLVYSYGNYRQVLIIGIATSIPRTLLYFIFVPIYGSAGAAISYTIGSIIGFAASIAVSKKIGMRIFWKDLFFILIIPTAVGFILDYFQINYIIAIITTAIISSLLLLKLRIISRVDIQDSLTLLPYSISKPIINILSLLYRKLNSFY